METTINLGFKARDWQAITYRQLKRFSVLVIHRRGGKTVQAVMKLIDAALRCTQRNGHFAYIAPQRNQAKGVAWDYIKHYAAQVPGVEINESELWVKFPNGAKVRIFGADDPNNLRGYYFDGVVIDEVAQMKRETWIEVLFPALTDRHKLDPTLGWAMFIGTPNGLNLLSDLFDHAQLNTVDWYAKVFTVYDTGIFTNEEIDKIRAEMRNDGKFRQEYLCDFKASSSDVLISLDEVDAATKRTYVGPEYEHAQKRLGVDVARFGDDKTVIYCRQGLYAGPYLELDQKDTQQVADRVALAVQKTGAEIVFVDQTGVGAGVVDALKRLRVRVVGVDSSESPTNPKYFNKRAEMTCEMADWIKRGGSIPYDDHALRLELTSIHYDYKNEKIIIEPKDKIKEAIGRSPDHADALGLTFASVEQMSNGVVGFWTPTKANMDFDPLRSLNSPNVRGSNYDPLDNSKL